MRYEIKLGDIYKMGSQIILIIKDKEGTLQNIVLNEAGQEAGAIGGADGEQLVNWIQKHASYKLGNLIQVIKEITK